MLHAPGDAKVVKIRGERAPRNTAQWTAFEEPCDGTGDVDWLDCTFDAEQNAPQGSFTVTLDPIESWYQGVRVITERGSAFTIVPFYLSTYGQLGTADLRCGFCLPTVSFDGALFYSGSSSINVTTASGWNPPLIGASANQPQTRLPLTFAEWHTYRAGCVPVPGECSGIPTLVGESFPPVPVLPGSYQRVSWNAPETIEFQLFGASFPTWKLELK